MQQDNNEVFDPMAQSNAAQSAVDEPTQAPDECPQDDAAGATARPVKPNRRRMYTRKIAVTGVFTALAYGLYLLGKVCKLPFIFPSFFDLQFSELPALIAGFMLGPQYGAAVIILKCLLKMPLTSTSFVGEATDMLLGLTLVLPSTLLYRRQKNIKGALLGVIVGSVCMVGASVLVNRFISIPFYLKFFFGGNRQALVGMLKPLFPNLTWQNFYAYYLCLSVIPFNLLRCVIMCGLTFAVYKRLSRLIKRWVGESATVPAAKSPSSVSLGARLCRQPVPAMWSILITVGALIVAILVGLWYCLR